MYFLNKYIDVVKRWSNKKWKIDNSEEEEN